ncbi:MAG: LPS assembly lipoprotein LptE [Pirellulales bacterium]
MHKRRYIRAAPSLAAVAILAITGAVGCAGYRVGAASLYSQQIRTVYVPMCESSSFRRNMGERLTEAIVKEIERTTSFKVVDEQNADSVLVCRLVSDTKRVTIENPLDDARDIEVNFAVQVIWTDRNGDPLQQQAIPLPEDMTIVNQNSSLLPEFGHSMVTAQNAAITRLAKQVVGLMEVPW